MFSKVTIILNSVCGYMLEKGEVKGERDEKWEREMRSERERSEVGERMESN